MKYSLVGLDPSLSNWGISLATYDSTTHTLRINQGFVIHTKPNKSKKAKNKQDLERTSKLYRGLFYSIAQADLWTAELPTGSQSARAMTSYGVCLGILGSLTNINPNLITVNPIDVKKQVGNSQASKDDVITWVLKNYPEVATWLPKAKNKAEHICDSIVTLHYLVNHSDFKELLMKITLSQAELEAIVVEELGNQGIDLSGKNVEMTFLEGAEIDINAETKPKRKTRKTKQEKETEVEVETETKTETNEFESETDSHQESVEDPFATADSDDDTNDTDGDTADDSSLFG